jgi:von Willebrand factor type A domain
VLAKFAASEFSDCLDASSPSKELKKMVRSSCLFLLLIAAACGSNGTAVGPCDVIPPNAACNLECSAQPGAPNTCPGGFYCSPDGRCFAQCTISGGQCGDGYSCTDDGHCVPKDQDPGTGNDPGCPAVAFTAKPVTPSIALVIDKSGSMVRNNVAPNVTRWAAVRTALVDPTNGVVTQLQSKAYFGLTTYGCIGNNPDLVTRPRALNNASSILAALAGNPDQNSNTPTTLALQTTVANFAATPPPVGSPPIIVLATDGLPNLCGSTPTTEDRKKEVIAAAAAAYAAGIRVIPLSVAAGTDAETHLQNVANAGAGVTAGQPNAPVYKGNNPAELKAAFDTIIGGVVSCDLTVNGVIDQSQAAGGKVRLNGRLLTFNVDWQLIGDHTIRLLGDSCTELKNAATPVVDGTFPCGVVIE